MSDNAMSTSIFPSTGDFILTDDLRGGSIVRGELVASYFVLRDEHATSVVISTPVPRAYQLGSVREHLPALAHRALTSLCEDVRLPIIFYECHAPAENTVESCVASRLTFDDQGELQRSDVPGHVMSDLIGRCLVLVKKVYGVSPAASVTAHLDRLASEGLGENVVRFRRRG